MMSFGSDICMKQKSVAGNWLQLVPTSMAGLFCLLYQPGRSQLTVERRCDGD